MNVLIDIGLALAILAFILVVRAEGRRRMRDLNARLDCPTCRRNRNQRQGDHDAYH